MEIPSPGKPGPIVAKQERVEISKYCREIVTDVQRILDNYFLTGRELDERQKSCQAVLRSFAGECTLVSIANIPSPEQKTAFRSNPAELNVVIKYAVETTDFEETNKIDLLEKIESLTKEDFDAILPAVKKLCLLESSSSSNAFHRAVFNRLSEDPDFSAADALIKMGSR